MHNNASQQTNKWWINMRRKAQKRTWWIFLLVTCSKLEIICAFVHKLGNFWTEVEIDWIWNDFLWSCAHSSILPTCWQSTASIKAWRGRTSAFRIRIKEEGDDSGRAGQKEGEMKQNECREMKKRKKGGPDQPGQDVRNGGKENRRSKRS